jgi:hypothetical protein
LFGAKDETYTNRAIIPEEKTIIKTKDIQLIEDSLNKDKDTDRDNNKIVMAYFKGLSLHRLAIRTIVIILVMFLAFF